MAEYSPMHSRSEDLGASLVELMHEAGRYNRLDLEKAMGSEVAELVRGYNSFTEVKRDVYLGRAVRHRIAHEVLGDERGEGKKAIGYSDQPKATHKRYGIAAYNTLRHFKSIREEDIANIEPRHIRSIRDQYIDKAKKSIGKKYFEFIDLKIQLEDKEEKLASTKLQYERESRDPVLFRSSEKRREYEREISKLEHKIRELRDKVTPTIQETIALVALPLLLSESPEYRELAVKIAKQDFSKITPENLELLDKVYAIHLKAYREEGRRNMDIKRHAYKVLEEGRMEIEKVKKQAEETAEAKRIETHKAIQREQTEGNQQIGRLLGSKHLVTILISFGIVGGLLSLFSFASNSATSYAVLPGVSSSTGFFIILLLLLSGGFLFYLFRK